MLDITNELKTLRLNGKVSAWDELQGTSAATDFSRWLIEHLLDEFNICASSPRSLREAAF